MKRFYLLTAVTFTLLCFLGTMAIAEDDEYGYACETCPANWFDLEPANNCGGPDQSPIAFSEGDAIKIRLPRLKVNYGPAEVVPEFTTTNIEWGVEENGDYFVKLEGKKYAFNQFHFHTTAEHVINGERSALEMHFVNKTEDGETIVLAVFIKAGDVNEAFLPITDSLPLEQPPPEDGYEPISVNLRKLLPKKLSAYRYTGSTTTPPCSGGVLWNLFKKHVELSDTQISAIQQAIRDINYGFDNNRPIQNLEGRPIFTGKSHRHWDDDDDDDEDDD